MYPEKGFGFIYDEENQEETWVQTYDCRTTFQLNQNFNLKKGIRVKFKKSTRSDGRVKAVMVCHANGDFFGEEFKTKYTKRSIPVRAPPAPVRRKAWTQQPHTNMSNQDPVDSPKKSVKKQVFEIKINKNDELSLIKYGY